MDGAIWAASGPTANGPHRRKIKAKERIESDESMDFIRWDGMADFITQFCLRLSSKEESGGGYNECESPGVGGQSVSRSSRRSRDQVDPEEWAVMGSLRFGRGRDEMVRHRAEAMSEQRPRT